MTTEWKVQVGKGKGSYKTTYTFKTAGQALFYYYCLNIHSGYKKRALDPDGKVLARYIS